MRYNINNSIKKGGEVNQQEKDSLLQDPAVREEIDRHKWFESERAGYDIGFEKAAQDWINQFAQDWLARRRAQNSEMAQAQLKPLKPRKRSAKSYLF